MIKKLRVTVDGTTYDVTVEFPDEVTSSAVPSAPVSAPAPPISPLPKIAPVSQPPVSSSPTDSSADVTTTPGDVPSPLAGRVTAIVVKFGQPIKEGDHLLTLEAMKMNTFVFAPRSGTIGEIRVAVGDAVEEGQPLITIQ
jgi:biotin carboxyl carrier protein